MRARHSSAGPGERRDIGARRDIVSRDQRRRCTANKRGGSNLSDTRWARPGPEIIARSEI